MSASSRSAAALALPAPHWRDLVLEAGSPRVRCYGRAGADEHTALVVHFHGGAFVSGSLDGGIVVSRLLVAAGAVVVSVDYPLAGEHPFPAALEAGHAALIAAYRLRTRLAGPRARLFVAGEEAGGNLAAALAFVARDRRQPPLAGQILLGPMLDPCLGTASVRRSEAGAAGCRWAEGWCSYLRKPAAAEHPYAVPGGALRLAGLPPALLFSAADDPMRDETRAYAQRLRAAGVAVCERELPAPSGWPAALTATGDAAPPWSESVRADLEAFLAAAHDRRTCSRKPDPPAD